MFIGLGDRHVSTTCGFASSIAGTTIGGGQFCFDHEFPGIHTAKVGLNYRFGGGHPILRPTARNFEETFSPASAGLSLPGTK
jgi:outer membrane immunogenic protein